MKKIIMILCCVFTSGISYCDWIEPYGEGCRNNLYMNNATVYGTISANDGIVNITQHFIDPVTATSSTYCNIYIATSTLQGDGTSWTTLSGKITNVGPYPRSVSGEITYRSVGLVQTTFTVVGSIRVIGYNAKNEDVDETLHVCSTATLVTINAFSKITSITVKMTSTSENSGTTGTPMASVEVHVGIGNKFGLANNITATSDIFKISEANTNIEYDNANVGIDTTYDTYLPVTVANGSNDYVITYRAKSR